MKLHTKELIISCGFPGRGYRDSQIIHFYHAGIQNLN